MCFAPDSGPATRTKFDTRMGFVIVAISFASGEGKFHGLSNSTDSW